MDRGASTLPDTLATSWRGIPAVRSARSAQCSEKMKTGHTTTAAGLQRYLRNDIASAIAWASKSALSRRLRSPNKTILPHAGPVDNSHANRCINSLDDGAGSVTTIGKRVDSLSLAAVTPCALHALHVTCPAQTFCWN
ncbi:unnamed protein product [Phytophthora lilii]|uniref:Unnamed protein product n=1 Tax=Phytophthora lilii TaxID=2077276 RepID=A0A9W6WSY1_9STRA|nr:unnamed protein product [Phytophthora lilii]